LKEMKRLLVFGASVGGFLHEKDGSGCQDAWKYRYIPPNMLIIAVSDGAGSSKKGELGAKMATDCAVNISPKQNLRELVSECVYNARKALEEKGKEDSIELGELACTLIVVAIREDKGYVAHIGDGAVVSELGDELEVISEPEESEYVNETTFLTDEAWELALRVREIAKFNALAIFTDGIQRGVLVKRGNEYIPYKGFFNPLFNYASSVKEEEKACKEIENLLKSEKFLKLSEDDKTLVIVIRRQ